jgi:uncharacterized membrane protein YfhO
LPPGRHEIVLSYRPDMFRIGAYLSLLAIALAAAFFGHNVVVKAAPAARAGDR